MNRSSKLGRVDVHCLLVDWCTLEIDKDYDLCQSMQVYGRVYDNSRTVYSYSPARLRFDFLLHLRTESKILSSSGRENVQSMIMVFTVPDTITRTLHNCCSF